MTDRFGSPRAVIALAALSLSTFTYVTTETLPIGLLSLMARDLGSTTSAIGLLVTGYGLVVVATSVPLTRLTRRLPRRLLLCMLLSVFIVATIVSAIAGSYTMLLVARMVTALSQALFWAVITPATASLFRPGVRGRALSILYAGGSVAALAGVPAGTWLAQQTSWRVAFFALSAIGVVILATIAALLPSTPAGQSDADHGSAPDAGRYWSVIATTAVAVTGAFTAFTYIGPYLTEVTGFAESSLGVLLLVRGLAGLAGVFIVGLLVDRFGWLTMAVLVAVQVVALAGQFLLGASKPWTVVMIAASGLTLAALSAALGARVLEVAPGGSDMASAGTSTAFNIGITAGAFLGSVLVDGSGVRGTALAGALLTALALVSVLAEPRLARRRPAEAGATTSPAGRSATPQCAAR